MLSSMLLLAGAALSSCSSIGQFLSSGTEIEYLLTKLVTVNPTPQQKITSFGASGAWWPNDLIRFPSNVQQQLAHTLFSQDGLYLSSYRYNMGGNGGNDTRTVTTSNRVVQSFLLRNGTYDFSRDHAGVTFLKYAQQYKVPYITFFVNAAPSNIASNGAACGWNFTANKVAAFAGYIQTVLSHFTNQGIDVRYISPMNEPDNSRSDCSQEGMSVAPTLRASIFNAIRAALDNSTASRVNIIGDESATVDIQGVLEAPLWLPAAAKSISNIAIHNYDFPPDSGISTYYNLVKTLTLQNPPPIKFTETCCSENDGTGLFIFGSQYDPTMTNALIDARYAWQFLTLAQAESFDWWTAVADLPCSPTIDGAQCATQFNSSNGFNSGLVYIDPNYSATKDYTLYFTKRAFMMKHYAFFHRPGSVRYDVPSTQLPEQVYAFATQGPGNTGLNLLFINQNNSTQNITLQVPSMAPKLRNITQTTSSVDWSNVAPLPKAINETIALQLPAQSLWTLQFGK